LLQKIREELLSRQGANIEEEEDDGKTEKKLLYIFLAIVSAFFSLCVLAIAFPPGLSPIQVATHFRTLNVGSDRVSIHIDNLNKTDLLFHNTIII
jgi:hypothetical protein